MKIFILSCPSSCQQTFFCRCVLNYNLVGQNIQLDVSTAVRPYTTLKGVHLIARLTVVFNANVTPLRSCTMTSVVIGEHLALYVLLHEHYEYFSPPSHCLGYDKQTISAFLYVRNYTVRLLCCRPRWTLGRTKCILDTHGAVSTSRLGR